MKFSTLMRRDLRAIIEKSNRGTKKKTTSPVEKKDEASEKSKAS